MTLPVFKTMPLDRTFDVDSHRQKITQEGSAEFFWPVSHREMLAFGKDVTNSLISALNTQEKNTESAIYKFTLKHLIEETCGIFHGDLLRERFEKSGVTPVVPQDWCRWPYLFEKEAPPLPPLIESLKAKEKKPNVVSKIFKNPKRILSLIKKMNLKSGGMEIDGLQIKSLTSDVLEHNIITTHRTNLICEHARQVKEDVVLCRYPHWFQGITDDEFQTAWDKEKSYSIDIMIEAIKSVYLKWDVPFLPHDQLYFTSYLKNMAVCLRLHYVRLLKRNDLPKRLWTGSGGNIWDLMLRHAALEVGGEVTGHDHGGGSGHVDMPYIGLVEFWACNKFITFNQKQVEELKKVAPDWNLIDDYIPEISFVSESTDAEIKIQSRFLKPQKPKKIFLLSTIYDRDRCRSYALYPDLVYVDWQARIITKLIEGGYEVYIKPHPESPVLPPKEFEDKLGAKIIDVPFEDIQAEADLIIYDYTYTSVFLAGFLSNTPLMIIDFEEMPWYKEAYNLANERCSIIKGYIDETNRIQVDWEAVEDGIVRAMEKCNNHKFVKTYYL